MNSQFGSGSVGGELRSMTVVFADLSDYTRLTAAHDLEDVAVAMSEIKARCERIVAAYGGVVNQVKGDGFLLLFGASVAHEDDPVRATEACLALHRAVRELRPPWGAEQLTMHSGIQTGCVLVAAGSPRDGEYTVTGDAVNVASRLSTSAVADEILAGEATFRQISHRFETVPPRSLQIKGKHERVLAYRVSGQAARPRQVVRMVGRDSQLQVLRDCFEQALAGRGRLVVAVGEAGVGKTRLVQEFAGSASPRGNIVMARCRAYPAAAPYAPLSQLVHSAVGARDGARLDRMSAEELASHLADLDSELGQAVPALVSLVRRVRTSDPLAPSGGPELQRSNIVHGLVRLLRAWAAAQPLVVVLEDWHDVDEASDAALVQMLRELRDCAVLFVVTCRPAGMSAVAELADATVELEPLARDETLTLVGRLCYLARVPDEFAAAVYERTQGNPFFVEEVCHALTESDSVHKAVADSVIDRAPLPIPGTIEAVLRARIDRLAFADRNLLKAAAVFGTEFSVEQLLRLMAGMDESASALRQLEWPSDIETAVHRVTVAGLVVASALASAPTFRFKHAITRAAAYALLPRRQRQALHARAATVLRAITDSSPTPALPGAMARHLMSAGEYNEALDYAEQAGDQAAERFALEEARVQYSNAIDCIDRQCELASERRRRVSLSLKWALACLYRPVREQLDVLAVSRRYAEEADDAAAAAHCLYWMGWIEHALGDQASSIEYTKAGLVQASRDGLARLEAQLYCNLGLSYAAATEYDTALEFLNRGISLRQSACGDREPVGGAYAYSIGYQGLIHAYSGRFTEAYRCLDGALRAVRRHRRVALQGSVLTELAMARLIEGDWEGCIDAASEIQVIAERIHGPYILAMSVTAAAYARYQLFRDADAIASMQAAASWLRDHGVELTLSWNYALLAEVCADQGQVERARKYADAALARGRWDRLGEVAAHRARAVAAAREAGSADAAVADLQRALACANAKGTRPDAAITRFRHASLFAEFGRTTDATTLATAALAAFESLRMPWYQDRARALLGSLP